MRRIRGSWMRRFPNQLYITVCWIERGGTPRVGHLDRAGRGRVVEQLEQHARDRLHRRLHALGMGDRELHRELRDRAAVVRAALARRLGGLAPLVEADREGAQTRERLGLGLDGLAEVVGGLADRVSSNSARSSSSLPSKYW